MANLVEQIAAAKSGVESEFISLRDLKICLDTFYKEIENTSTSQGILVILEKKGCITQEQHSFLIQGVESSDIAGLEIKNRPAVESFLGLRRGGSVTSRSAGGLLISCTHCNSKFKIKQLPKKVSKFKCGKCQKYFIVTQKMVHSRSPMQTTGLTPETEGKIIAHQGGTINLDGDQSNKLAAKAQAAKSKHMQEVPKDLSKEESPKSNKKVLKVNIEEMFKDGAMFIGTNFETPMPPIPQDYNDGYETDGSSSSKTSVNSLADKAALNFGKPKTPAKKSNSVGALADEAALNFGKPKTPAKKSNSVGALADEAALNFGANFGKPKTPAKKPDSVGSLADEAVLNFGANFGKPKTPTKKPDSVRSLADEAALNFGANFGKPKENNGGMTIPGNGGGIDISSGEMTIPENSGGIDISGGGMTIPRNDGGIDISGGGMTIPGNDSGVDISGGGMTIPGNDGGVDISGGGITIPGNGGGVDISGGGMTIPRNDGGIDISGGGMTIPGNDGGIDISGGGMTIPGNDSGIDISGGGMTIPGNDGGIDISGGGMTIPENSGNMDISSGNPVNKQQDFSVAGLTMPNNFEMPSNPSDLLDLGFSTHEEDTSSSMGTIELDPGALKMAMQEKKAKEKEEAQQKRSLEQTTLSPKMAEAINSANTLSTKESAFLVRHAMNFDYIDMDDMKEIVERQQDTGNNFATILLQKRYVTTFQYENLRNNLEKDKKAGRLGKVKLETDDEIQRFFGLKENKALIRFSCPHCSTKYKVRINLKGGKFKCGTCKEYFFLKK